MSNSISTKLVNQALKVRLYPTIEQKSFLDKTFGCSRFVYNSYLAEKNKFFEENVKPIREEFDYYNLLEKFNKLQKNKEKSSSKTEFYQNGTKSIQKYVVIHVPKLQMENITFLSFLKQN